MKSNSIRYLEELSFNAHPSLQTQYYDGWVLRFANGYSSRANSVNAIYPSTIDLKEKIEECEKRYFKHDLPCIFKVTDENAEKTIKEEFFVGISFTKEPVDDYIGTDKLPSRNLLLFSKDADDSWQIAQTSLLPKLEHGETKDSIKIFGDLNVDDNIAANKIVIADDGEISTPQLRVNRITSNEGSITVDNKKLIINKSLEMTAKADAESPAKATIEQAVIGDLTVKVDTNLKNSTGKITAKEVVAEKITQNGKVIPAIDLVQNGEVYQLQITLDASKK
jgi:hypothetical protein